MVAGDDTWSGRDYAANARFVADLGAPVLDLLAPQPGERVLDLGCGDGALTEAIAARGAAVVGVDDSADMVRAARARGLDARVMNGERLDFDRAFDAVFSNAALHWMLDADAVAAGAAKALVPGGRFIGEMGGHGNVAAIAVALRAVLGGRGPDPSAVWFFPTLVEYAGLLGRHGFTVEQATLVPRPTLLPTDMTGWLATFSTPFLGALPSADRAPVLAEVERLLSPTLRTASGVWIADYVRLRFAAHLPR